MQAELADCKTIIWNGPMGVFEMAKFAAGTNDVAKTLAECTAKGAITVSARQRMFCDACMHTSSGSLLVNSEFKLSQRSRSVTVRRLLDASMSGTGTGRRHKVN